MKFFKIIESDESSPGYGVVVDENNRFITQGPLCLSDARFLCQTLNNIEIIASNNKSPLAKLLVEDFEKRLLNINGKC